MKKTISLILIVLIAFTSNTVLAVDDISGTWYATEMSIEGISIDPSMFGYEITFTFYEDKTFDVCTVNNADSTDNTTGTGTWSFDGKTVIAVAAGGPLPLAYDGETLTGVLSGTSFTFTRKTSKPKSFEEIYANDRAMFDGAWSPVQLYALGIYIDLDDPASFGMNIDSFRELVFKIKDGMVWIGGTEEPVRFDLVNGSLVGQSEYAEGPLNIRLLEGDRVGFEMKMESLPVTLICSRVIG